MPGKQPAADRPAPWESGLVIVDKPGGMTSHDVVARIRRLAHTRRVGHAGTLDPMATGVLVTGVEKATRLLGHLMLTEKTYTATIRLGQSTSTDDAEGEPTGGSPAGALPRAAIEAEIARLTGDILQVPSSVSAVKVNGERAYKLTRAGHAPELAARPVTVYDFIVTAVRPLGDYLDLEATIRCSSGTYVRALARDLGAALGTGGHLTALRRTAVGPYTLAQAHTLDDLANQDQASERLRPAPVPHGAFQGPPGTGGAAAAAPGLIPLADAAAAAFPCLRLAGDEARRLAQGARLPVPAPWPPPAEGTPAAHRAGGATPGRPEPGNPVAAFGPDGTLVALVVAADGRLRSLAVFVDGAAKSDR